MARVMRKDREQGLEKVGSVGVGVGFEAGIFWSRWQAGRLGFEGSQGEEKMLNSPSILVILALWTEEMLEEKKRLKQFFREP
jgi:hypothetical protein